MHYVYANAGAVYQGIDQISILCLRMIYLKMSFICQMLEEDP